MTMAKKKWLSKSKRNAVLAGIGGVVAGYALKQFLEREVYLAEAGGRDFFTPIVPIIRPIVRPSFEPYKPALPPYEYTPVPITVPFEPWRILQ